MTEYSNDLQKISNIYKAQMTNADFDKLSKFIYTTLGIKMPDVKKLMLQSRLQKRLSELNFASYAEYISYVFSKEGQANELTNLMDIVTTNKTDFFREPTHFEHLTQVILPEFINYYSGKRVLKVWSAGCSSGEEPYTLAIVLTEFAKKNPNFDFSIYGTDISSRILNKAMIAVYGEDRISDIPIELKSKYFLKSKDRIKKTVRVVTELRNKVKFERLNFMDSNYSSVNELFDIIFCRNVLIYFDRDTQESVINKLASKLKTGGYFFLGHSESITNMKVPLKHIKPTIFAKEED
ncbi:MAG: chemotaxis protein CheR [Bacteroidetes bacterium GWE2_29_8]|nr:MAG: chemotaxis protein CheR [Bacteroidetes bacterium GWE2_29_8]OFY20079.1 MAG: chemotaxis protein CheR [Bacteroidetes bacterium GWF2_29_10]